MFGLAINALVSGVSSWWGNKQEMKKAEHENKLRLLSDEHSNNHEWEMANLQDKDKWMRRASFILFTTPIVWVGFDPAGAKEYFSVLDNYLPDWYKSTYMAITGGIWGISSLKNTLPGVLSAVAQAVRKGDKDG